MIRLVIKKLWRGHMISIRDYLVKSGIQSGGIEVTHDSKTMFLSPEILKAGTGETKQIPSKFNQNQKYNLIDFRWNPDDETQSV